MSSDDILRAAVVLCAQALKGEINSAIKRKKRTWTRKWIYRRLAHGASEQLFQELALENPIAYRKILRISCEKFEELLKKIDPLIKKKRHCNETCYSSRTKLEMITLRYLATGDSYQSLELLFRFAACTICQFLPEVLEAIKEVLWEYLKAPEEWQRIMNGFEKRWNFPNCAGVIDGKHVVIKRPGNSGSEFYNYKGTYSIILFAMVDHDYNFTFLDIEANGRANDSAVFRDSKLNEIMENNLFNFPKNAVILGDDAFPLRLNLLKPYSKKNLTEEETIFNYRLSRARRQSEDTFGILVWRFGIFLRERAINQKPERVDKIVWTACAIHNWLRQTSASTYLPKFIDVEAADTTEDVTSIQWREQVQQLTIVNPRASNKCTDAERVRKKYAEYFVGEGALSWQLNKIGRNTKQ